MVLGAKNSAGLIWRRHGYILCYIAMTLRVTLHYNTVPHTPCHFFVTILSSSSSFFVLSSSSLCIIVIREGSWKALRRSARFYRFPPKNKDKKTNNALRPAYPPHATDGGGGRTILSAAGDQGWAGKSRGGAARERLSACTKVLPSSAGCQTTHCTPPTPKNFCVWVSDREELC